MTLAQHPSFSIEVFPPNSQTSAEKLYKALQDMKALQPDYISVTCSNANRNIEETTIKVAQYIKEELDLKCIAHLPAVYLSKEQVTRVLTQLQAIQVDGLLALRGDIWDHLPVVGDFHYATDLIAFIREHNDQLPIYGACYPETHPDSTNRITDIACLKRKVDAGCQELITQLFFDNELFYDFKERCQIAGIDVPIIAGIMPIVNRNQALRLIQTTKAKLPRKFLAILEKYEHHPQALRDAGLAYAVDQMMDLLTQDTQGIHLYAMNQADVASHIYKATRNLFVA